MKRFIGREIEDIIYGATFFGGGGGGACESGLNALKQFMEDHGITDINDLMVQMIESQEMDEGGYAACTAAMGAPTKFKEVRIAPYINGSFEHLCNMGRRMNREILYSISVELGGFNTLVPLLIAMEKGIPFVDADGSGRAVPALDTLLLHVNGMQTSPLAMSDNKGNRVGIELESAMDAPMGEAIGRNICVAFDQMGGLSGWMCKGKEISDNLPLKTVSLCQQVGHIAQASASAQETFKNMMQLPDFHCTMMVEGTVVHAENQQVEGFDKGMVVIRGNDGAEWRTYYLNENLILERNGEVVMTAPDIICYCRTSTGKPLSNADIVSKTGEILIDDVTIGTIKVNESWWRSGMDYLQKIWGRYFTLLDHPGLHIVPYPGR